MNTSPDVGQIWAWESDDLYSQEIILLTRIDKNKFCHGILLFIDNDEFLHLIGTEVCACIAEQMNHSNGWSRII